MPTAVKNTTLPNLLDLLAPHSCRGCNALGSPFCNRCKKYLISERQNICPVCKTVKTTPSCSRCPNLPPIFIAGPRDGTLGQLINDLKFHSVRALAKPLAEVLNAILPEDLGSPLVIVPLPTISKHIRLRGLDHTLLIARHLARLRKDTKVEPLLLRAKNTVQVGSDAETRKAQATSAYTLNPKLIISPNATCLLLDDIWTTGASMLAAYDLLKNSSAKNIVLATLALNKTT